MCAQFLIIAMILAVPLYSQNTPKNPNSDRPQYQNSAADKSSPSPAQHVAAEGNENTASNTKDDPGKSTLATWIYTFLTLILCVLVGAQVHAYWAKERAWMLIDLRYGNPATNNVKGVQIVEFSARLHNFGHSPARILGIDHLYDVLPREQRLPSVPDYITQASREYTPQPIAPNGGFPLSWHVTQKEMDEMTTGEQILWVYGRVRYKDIFGRKRETRYCFRYYPGIAGSANPHYGFFPEGPAIYHKLS